LQALATFPSKISAANLKEVGKLKGVGKGSLDKVRAVTSQFLWPVSIYIAYIYGMQTRYAAVMPGPGHRCAQTGRSVLPVQISGIPGTQNWDVRHSLCCT
jgi:hypothetical protein